jgi:AraC-like DNA-binding protein
VFIHTCTTRGEQHDSITGCFVNESRLTPLVDLLTDTMAQEAAERSESGYHLVRSLLLTLMLLLAARFRSGHGIVMGENDPAGLMESSGLGAASLPRAQIVARACAFIDDQFTSNLAVADVARHTYVSAPHLNRLFRQELNMSVMEYVTTKRLELARTLLRTTDISVGDISGMLGYRHANYLNYLFQHHTQETPRAYRRRTHGG